MSSLSAASPAPAAPWVVEPDDRRFCRAALPLVSRTFALNTRLLAGTLGEAVRAGYLLCRAADALEDSWPGAPSAIRDRFDRFLNALSGDGCSLASLSQEARSFGADRADLALLADLPRLLRVRDALPPAHAEALTWGVGTLARGMC